MRLVGSVPHGEVAAWLGRADIYVSLNHLGNLSNANLEAIAAGKCMIILDEDARTHTDMETTRLIPDDAVLRIGRDSMEANLARALESLLDAPERITSCAAATARLALLCVVGTRGTFCFCFCESPHPRAILGFRSTDLKKEHRPPVRFFCSRSTDLFKSNLPDDIVGAPLLVEPPILVEVSSEVRPGIGQF